MSHKVAGFGVVLLLALSVGLAYTGWKIHNSSKTEVCYACGRAIHLRTRTVATVNGKRQIFCCPMCVLSDHEQTHRLDKIVELTDFPSGKPLAPQDAYIVEGSRVNLCIKSHDMLGEHKQTRMLAFDRCSPSIITFARREDAEQFLRQNGGRLMPFRDMAAEHQH